MKSMYSQSLDIDILPKEVRGQLIDYYTFLVNKYGNVKSKTPITPTFSKADIDDLGEISLTIEPLEFQKKMRDEWE